MTSRRCPILLCLLALIAITGTAWAAGPLDGSYPINVSVTGEDAEPVLWYIVALQNDNVFGMALLDPESSWWSYGYGPLGGDLRATGPILDSTGLDIGQFDLHFQDGTIRGTMMLFEVPLTVSGGNKIF